MPYAKSFILRGEFGESLRIGTAHYSQFNFTVNLVLKNGDFYLNYTGSELNLGVYRQGLINFKREPQFRDWSKGRKEYDEIISKEIRLKSSPEDSVEEISEEVANYLKRIFSIFKKFKSRY